MSHDQRPQLPPPNIYRSEYQTKQKDSCGQIEPCICVQKSPEARAGQYGRPNSKSFQCMDEVTYLDQLFKNWIDDRNENYERQRQAGIRELFDPFSGWIYEIKDQVLKRHRHEHHDKQKQ